MYAQSEAVGSWWMIGAVRGDRLLTPGNAIPRALAVACMMLLAQPALAQENDPELNARLDALEQELRDQRNEFEAQRELLERTIHEQQKNLEAQQRQLSAQYELIRELQTERGAAPPAPTTESRKELAATPRKQSPADGTAGAGASAARPRWPACAGCSQVNEIVIDPLSYMSGPSRGVSVDIHRIASVYHWSEAEILSLPRQRRRRYLDLIDRARGMSV